MTIAGPYLLALPFPPTTIRILTLNNLSHPHHVTTSIMTDDKRPKKSRILNSSVGKLKHSNGSTRRDPAGIRTDVKEEGSSSSSQSPYDKSSHSASHSPAKGSDAASPATPSDTQRHEDIVGGEVTIKQEPGQPPKLSRSTSRKIVTHPPHLYDECEDKTEEAKRCFQVIPACSYSSKYIGSSEQDSMDCDCTEEWGKATQAFVYFQIWPTITDASSQIAMRKPMQHVVQIQIVSIVLPRWSASATAGAEQIVKTNVSRPENMQMLPSSKQKRKVTVYGLMLRFLLTR